MHLIVGALSAHRCTKTANNNPQNPIAIKSHLLYHHTHSGWIVLSVMEFSLPHNPLVAGSSPACPTFSTIPSQQLFCYYASVIKPCFYAILTHSAESNWNKPAYCHCYFIPFSPNLKFQINNLQNQPLGYQILLQVRKICVNICLSIIHTTLSKGFIYQKQRIMNPLFQFILQYYKVIF